MSNNMSATDIYKTWAVDPTDPVLTTTMDELAQMRGNIKSYNKLSTRAYQAMIHAVYSGKFDEVKDIFRRFPEINCPSKATKLFEVACLYERKDIAEWLLEVQPKLNPHFERDSIYIGVSEHNKPHMLDWLNSKFNFSTNTKNKAFGAACRNNCLDVAQWFCKNNGYTIDIKDGHIMDYCMPYEEEDDESEEDDEY